MELEEVTLRASPSVGSDEAALATVLA